MFKFGFHVLDENDSDENETGNKQWYEAKEIFVDIKKYNCMNSFTTKVFENHGIKLKYVSFVDVMDKLKKINESTNSILRAENDFSDLVSAEYEGGLKIWECTSDLLTYLNVEDISFSNKKVLDLGCGAGLLGIFTLLKGSLVEFQDYNQEVIEYTTIPNVLLNLNNAILKSCKFYAGDWKSFTNLSKSKYDYILTSETIYNPDNYQKLIEIFSMLLETNGIVYLSAKTYYFGVGGSIRQFEKILKKNELFTSSVVWTNSEGVQREILKIVKN